MALSDNQREDRLDDRLVVGPPQLGEAPPMCVGASAGALSGDVDDATRTLVEERRLPPSVEALVLGL
jgi:hypothetical protein